jgi:ATP/maltotriose-dependent transcriptional regulator MalT
MPGVSNASRLQEPVVDNHEHCFGPLHETLTRLEQGYQELMQRQLHLENLQQQLLETNNALFGLTKKVELARQEAKEQVISQVKLLLFPFLERLKEDQGMKPYEPQLSHLIRCIEQVDPVPPASTSPSEIPSVLTSQEQRIASMIRLGLTNDDIAKRLHIAPTTVKTHRRNIRKKLGITGGHNRLSTYLQMPAPWHFQPLPGRSAGMKQLGESHGPTVIPLYPVYPGRFPSFAPKELYPLS